MVTIFTNEYGLFTSKEAKYSKSTIRLEVVLDKEFATCNCPICNKKIVIDRDGNPSYQCDHLLSTEGYNPFFALFFDMEECVIFDFDEIQDAILLIKNKSDRNKIINRLNSCDYKEVIPAEWEVVVTKWLSTLGHLEYENSNSKGRKPDIFWESFDKEIKFSADIKTVFDQFDRDYPAAEFCQCARDIMMKYIPNSWACEVRFESKDKGVPQIFPKSRFPENLGKIETGIQKIQSSITCGNTYTFTVEGHSVSFSVRDADGYFSLGFRAKYYAEHDKNPLYNGLKDKACQLVRDGDELLGVFLCDGGTNTINPVIKGIHEIRLNAILDSFFKEEEHIDFVAVFGISTPPTSTLRFEFYLNYYKKDNICAQKLKFLLENNACRFSQHRDYPTHVQQKIAHAQDGVRKMFCNVSMP